MSVQAATLYWPVPNHKTISQGFHDGCAIDISDGSIKGANIVAAYPGTVYKKYTCSHNTYPDCKDCCLGVGTGIVIKGDDGRYYTYAHMKSGSIPSSISVGTKVKGGYKIGKVGNTGCSNGAHLHFGITKTKKWWGDGSNINPKKEKYIYLSEPYDNAISTIKYNANGGSGSMSNTTVKYNTTLTLPANSFTKGGYSFAGWNAYRASDAKWYTNEGTWQTASLISNNGYTKKIYDNKWSGIFNNSWLSGNAKDTFTFYATWKPTVSTFTFNANGGIGTMSNVTVTTDTILSVPSNAFTKTGCSFAGWNAYRTSDAKWYTNEGGWQTSSAITNNGYSKKVYENNCSGIFNNSWLSGKEKDTFTLYATWKSNVLSVKYNANGGSIDSGSYYLNSNGNVCKYSTNSELTDPWTYNETHTNGLCNASTFGLYKTGYVFKGWITYDNGTQTFNDDDSTVTASKINKNIANGSCITTLYALWEKEVCSHSFTCTVTKTPSCQENGVETFTCSICGFITSETIPALGHKWDNGVVTEKATPTATGVKTYSCTVCGLTKTEDIAKCDKYVNPIVAKGKTVTIKYSNLKKKNQSVANKNAFTVSKAKGKVTYKKSSGNKNITVSSAGKITIKKGLKKGNYKVKVKVTAAGNASYKAKTVTVTVTIKVN